MFLEVEDLVKFYGEGENRVKVLKGISTGVEKGETVVLEDREAEQFYLPGGQHRAVLAEFYRDHGHVFCDQCASGAKD